MTRIAVVLKISKAIKEGGHGEVHFSCSCRPKTAALMLKVDSIKGSFHEAFQNLEAFPPEVFLGKGV